jgi:hypothetical protein
VRTLEEDRPLFDDINTLAKVIKEGELLDAVESVVGIEHEEHLHEYAGTGHAH